MEKQEKWQSFGSRLGRVRLKIILGVFVSLFFLSLLSWIAFKSFQNILAAVEKLSSPRVETGLVNEMITDISEIQAYSGQYSISKNPVSLKNYRQKSAHVRTLIDSLKNESGSREYEDKLDTLRMVFEEYVVALDEWILIRSKDVDVSEYKMYGLLQAGDSSLKRTTQFLPKAEITNITKTVEKPAVQEVAEPAEKTSKWRTRKNRKAATAAAKVDSVSKETITETITKVDSSYLFRVDTLLGKMKETLNKSKNYRSGLRKRMSARETELLETELALMDRIRTLLDDIGRQESMLTQTSLEMSKATAQESYRQLIVLGIIAMSVLFLLGITLFSDISKSLFYRKKLQEAKQEAERLAMAKEEFLANMSHEIRTPINSIIGFTEQLQQNDLAPGEKAKVHAIWRSSSHLLALVNDILDFSKLEADSLHLERIGFCYTDVVEEVIEMVEPEALKKNIHISFEPNAASETMVAGDPVRIKQIFLNLMSNAVKFTEKGHISICVEKKQVRDNIRITCRVKDSGKGIKPGELVKIFMKFEQEDNSITRHHGGTGLGLSISKKLTELQGGKIWAESEIGTGSVFSFEIPFISAEQNEYKNSVNPAGRVSGFLQGRKILVVDDDPVIAEILAPLFREWMAEAVFYHHPEQARKAIYGEKFDLVLVDLHMPKINGLDLIHEMRTRPESQNRDTVTILCTANVIKNIQETEKGKNPDYILYKPYKRKDILNTIQRALDIQIPEETHTGPHVNAAAVMEEGFTLRNFKEFAGNDLKLLDDFITLFISESESELERLDSHLQQKNYKQIGETAHMFKNTFGQLEAKYELSIIKKLEGLVKDHQEFSEVEIGRLIAELQARSKVLFVDLRAEMDRLKRES